MITLYLSYPPPHTSFIILPPFPTLSPPVHFLSCCPEILEIFPLTIGRAHLSDFNFSPLGSRALSWQTVWNYWRWGGGRILIEFGRASYSSEENTWEVRKLSWEIRGGWEEMCEVVASSPHGYFTIRGSLITHAVHEQYDMSLQLRMSFQR